MRFNVTLDRDEDGVWVAECYSIPGCVSQGKSKKEALVNVKEAIQMCLEKWKTEAIELEKELAGMKALAASV